jgi:hypothetical protein
MTTYKSAPTKPSILQVIRAVGASMLGVQSNKNYQDDFATQSVVPYLVVGVIFVIILILSLVALVNVLVP